MCCNVLTNVSDPIWDNRTVHVQNSILDKDLAENIRVASDGPGWPYITVTFAGIVTTFTVEVVVGVSCQVDLNTEAA